MKKAMTLTVLAAASLLATATMAQDKAPVVESAQALKAVADAMGAGERLTTTALVVAVDHKHRTLTLQDEDGKTFTIEVGDEVRNLAQVQAGDTVMATYSQALLLSLETIKGTGINERLVTVSASRAPEGTMPAAAMQEKVQMIGTVRYIDQEKRTVAIQGAVHHVNLKVPADMDIKDLKVGDQVRATYVQELAVVVGATAPR